MPRTIKPLDVALALEQHGDPDFLKNDLEKAAPVLPARIKPSYLRTLHKTRDPNEIIKHRFLCRGGSLLNVGPTGVGKSSLIMQMGVCWALGRDFFGLSPAAPVKSVFLQAENDDLDMAEMLNGVLNSMPLSEEEHQTVDDNLSFYREDSKSGEAFVRVLRGIIQVETPHVAFVDPAFAYVGGNVSDQAFVTPFLRNMLQPLIRQEGVGLILNHHSNKPPTGKEKQTWKHGDFAYLGSGSSEWANWSRAVMGLISTEEPGIYKLVLGKRGRRAGWTEGGLYPVNEQYIAHAREPEAIYWRGASDEEREAAGWRRKPAHQEMIDILAAHGGEMHQAELVAALEKIGGKKSHAYNIIRSGSAAGSKPYNNVVRTTGPGNKKKVKSTGKMRPTPVGEDPCYDA